MRDKEEFFQILTDIDGHSFEEYAKVNGDFDFSRYMLKVHSVPSKPGAEKALFIIRITQQVAGFPPFLFNSPLRRTALEDLLTREVADQLDHLAAFDAEGRASQRIRIARPGQKILPRTSLTITDDNVEARVYIELPSRDGKILGDEAKHLFFEDLPVVVNNALLYCNLDEEGIEEFVYLMEDADQLRQLLPTRGWVSFIGEGSMPSREIAGDLPDFEGLDTLTIDDNLIVEVEVPNGKQVRGMGVPSGITVVLGDVYSGRRELIESITAGIYNHIPGDGRELVVTVPDAVAIKSDPGRSVHKVDISPFLKGGAARPPLSTDRADAFTSQAASTIEALEVGAHVLLFNEEDAAASFLVRDARLKKLHEDDTSIIPLQQRARQMVDDLGVSLVIGGSTLVTEFIPIADTVLRVRDFHVDDITEEAKALSISSPQGPVEDSKLTELVEQSRWLVPISIDPSTGRYDSVIHAPHEHALQFGRSLINLNAIPQLADAFQTTTIGLIMSYARTRYMDESRPIREILDLVDRDLSMDGLECITRELRGDLTRPRRYEIASALNRLDTLRVSEPSE